MAGNVLVTGASRGIGRAAALLFAKEGWRVAIGYYKSESDALSLLNEIASFGGQAVLCRGDLKDRAQAFQVVEQAENVLGHLDALINNAGSAQYGLLTDLTEKDWRQVCGANLDSAVYCTQAAARGMIKRHAGAVVNVSSMWGQVGASCEAAYSAAKAGIIGLTKALAQELGPSGIRVNCVAPGVIQTDMLSAISEETAEALRQDTPLGEIGKPEDVAQAILFLASARARFITGQILGVNGGFVL